MEGITNEIRNKIKCAVKAKLQEIGAYVDEELPDYIMVMIANRRSKSQMTSELSLFLGSHTDKFTDWLHVVLEKLEAFISSSNASEKTKEAILVAPTSGSESGTIPEKIQNSSPTVMHPPSGLLIEKNSETQCNITTESVLINHENKEQYVPTPVSLPSLPTAYVHHSLEGDMDDDCLNIREEGEQDFRASEEMIQRKKNSKSSATYQAFRPDSQKRRHTRNVEDRSSKKACREERERPRRTEGRISSQIVSVVRPMLSQIVKPMESKAKVEKKELEEETSFNNKSGINSIVRVTARRRLPARMQATNCLILKAVAEAQKSVVFHPAKVMEPETRSTPALFTRKYREKNVCAESVAVTIGNSAGGEPPDQSTVEIDIQPSEKIVNDAEVVNMEAEETIYPQNDATDLGSYEPMESPPRSQFDDQEIETRFIVTLDGVHSLMSRCFDKDMNDDDATEMVEVQDTERKPVKSRLFRRRSTGTEAEIQQTLERCKFYPNCRQGERCNFHHPKTPCKNFPICLFGDNCLFIHPLCKFDATCNRKSCPYTHSQRSQTIVPIAPKIIRPVVKLHQKSPVVNGKTVCKFFPACNNVSCLFFHPPACKYGSNCTRVGCTFFHQSNISSANKLKWTTIAK